MLRALSSLLLLGTLTSCSDRFTYKNVAQICITEYRAADERPRLLPVEPQEYAYIMQARALLDGWEHSYVHFYLRALRRLQNADGGYGINTAWDAFGDGTINHTDTTYGVTIADHVGMPLLAAYEAGVRDVTVAELRQLVAVLDRLPEVEPDCLAYSAARNDQPPNNGTGCVLNVNVGIAAFLARAADTGVVSSAEHDQLIARIVTHMQQYFDADTREWPYTTDVGSHTNDVNHASYLVDSVQRLDPAFASHHGLVRHGLTRHDYRHWGDWIGQQRLVQYDCFSVTWELLRAQSLLYDARMTPLSYAQLALWSAKAHEACE